MPESADRCATLQNEDSARPRPNHPLLHRWPFPASKVPGPFDLSRNRPLPNPARRARALAYREGAGVFEAGVFEEDGGFRFAAGAGSRVRAGEGGERGGQGIGAIMAF